MQTFVVSGAPCYILFLKQEIYWARTPRKVTGCERGREEIQPLWKVIQMDVLLSSFFRNTVQTVLCWGSTGFLARTLCTVSRVPFYFSSWMQQLKDSSHFFLPLKGLAVSRNEHRSQSVVLYGTPGSVCSPTPTLPLLMCRIMMNMERNRCLYLLVRSELMVCRRGSKLVST